VGAQAPEALGGIRKPVVLGIIDEHDVDANRNRPSRLLTLLRGTFLGGPTGGPGLLGARVLA
jgi:hypothetical protein